MKKLLVLSMVLMSFVSYGQTEVSDTLDYNRFKEDGYLKEYRNNHQFAAMKMLDGSIIKAGDQIVIGKPSSVNTIAQTNVGLVGGSISQVSAFNYLTVGRLGLSVMAGMQYLPANYTNKKATVKEIKKGWTIIYFGDNEKAVSTVMNVLEAVNTGEIVNPNAAMTRDQAIAKLKEQKDLLDLGMITKEQFDKIKLELTPIVMKTS
jgi:hypothetical protein